MLSFSQKIIGKEANSMYDTLKEFYYGDIRPNEKEFDHNSQLQESMLTIARNEELLTKLLSGKEKRCFLEFVNAYSEMDGALSCEYFLYGFRMAARFLMEILDDSNPMTSEID